MTKVSLHFPFYFARIAELLVILYRGFVAAVVLFGLQFYILHLLVAAPFSSCSAAQVLLLTVLHLLLRSRPGLAPSARRSPARAPVLRSTHASCLGYSWTAELLAPACES